MSKREELERRIAALEAKLNAQQPPDRMPLRVVIVHGCLPPGEPLFATAGAHEWLREPGEDLEAFAKRAAQATREVQEGLLVIGGLPQSEAQHELALKAYSAWLLTADGVPPVEERAGRPAGGLIARRQ